MKTDNQGAPSHDLYATRTYKRSTILIQRNRATMRMEYVAVLPSGVRMQVASQRAAEMAINAAT